MTKPIIGITLDYINDNELNKYSDFPWYALRQQYSSIILKNGGIPIFLPFEAYQEDIDTLLEMLDGLLIPGGDLDVAPSMYNEEIKFDTKPCFERCKFESQIILEAFKLDMPILGICHGMQLVNVLKGGSLYQNIILEIPGAINHKQEIARDRPSHNIIIEEESLLYQIVGLKNFSINSSHRQAVKKLGEGLIASAYCSDDRVVEAIESTKNSFVIGIEWHPECEASAEQDNKIFSSFINAAKKYNAKTS